MTYVEGLGTISAAAALIIGAAAIAPSAGCAGDHDRLKKDEPLGGEGGTGGEGGAGGASASSSTGSGGSGGIQEPPGPPQLTVVNGTVDEDAIRLCFVPYPAGATSETPWPEATRLDYASGEVIDIDAVVPTSTDVEVVLISGTFASTDGETCADLIDAPPTGVLTRSLGLLPESVFVTEKSILLATAGCVGGRNHEHEHEALVCGFGYSVDQPNATLVAGFMSRLTEGGKVPLQFVQASLGLDEINVRVTPGNGSTALSVVTDWTYGAIAPYPPYTALSKDQLGAIDMASIQLFFNGSQSPAAAHTWGSAFSRSDMSPDDVTNGVGLAFVAVGASPLAGSGSWWNDTAFAVVRADP